VKRDIRAYFFVRHRLLRLRVFLPHDTDFWGFALLPRRDGIFLDVGANDGISALSFRVVDATTPILSIEPNPYHKTMLLELKRRISSFDFKIIGAGESECTLPLYTPFYKGFPITAYASHSEDAARRNLNSAMFIPGIGENAEFLYTEVSIIPLDGLGLQPSMIKIDVEGFESSVLSGLRQTLRLHHPTVMIEYNPLSYDACWEIVRELGYETFRFDHNRRQFVSFRDEKVLNVFFIHPVTWES
jgi:FkbM family methyltransferase